MNRSPLAGMLLASAMAVGCNKPPAGSPGSRVGGPNYSNVPCADNCGNDATCMSQCQPAGNSPPPVGLTPNK